MPDFVSLFWTVSTSYVVLGAVSIILLAALVLGYFPLLKWFPVVGPYVPAGKLVSLLAMGLLCGLLAVRMTSERYDARQAAAQVKALQARNALLDMVNRLYADQAAKDADDLSRLREHASDTPANGGPCLDEGAAGRIGAIR